MPDWTKSMRQTFEYYLVNPSSWWDERLLDNVKSCTINWDLETDTLGSATIDATSMIEFGPYTDPYIRVYLVTVQNGVTERHPLGVFMVQTPSTSFDGRTHTISMDAYTPLIELKEKNPPIGYSILEGENIMDIAGKITKDNLSAPVDSIETDKVLYSDFVAETDDTWLTFIRDLLANAGYSFSLDNNGRVQFAPDQSISSLQPVKTFDDSNSSLLYPEITVKHDLYGLPNVVEVVYSNGRDNYFSRVVNENYGALSTFARGREIVYRETNPSFAGEPTQELLDEYAKKLLKDLSSIECTVSYTHGYCGVRLGDCVRLDYERAGIKGVKAKVISQTIKCEPGCPVSEKAVYTEEVYWG